MTKTNLPFRPNQFESFDESSKTVLAFLKERLGFKLWMTTRVAEPHLIVLNADDDNTYGIERGNVFKWMDSFCSRMVTGKAPQFAPEIRKIEAYRSAPVASKLDVSAYIGVPVTTEDGALFGTLCAIDPEPQPADLIDEIPLILMLADLLGSIASKDLNAMQYAKALDFMESESTLDYLTGLLNRRGWEERVNQEEFFARSYHNPISVFILDLDDLKLINDRDGHDAGDRLLKSAADCLKNIFKEMDINTVARIGGDEFAVLAVGNSAKITEEAVLTEFRANKIAISLGRATHIPSSPVSATILAADTKMYKMKAEHRSNS